MKILPIFIDTIEFGNTDTENLIFDDLLIAKYYESIAADYQRLFYNLFQRLFFTISTIYLLHFKASRDENKSLTIQLAGIQMKFSLCLGLKNLDVYIGPCVYQKLMNAKIFHDSAFFVVVNSIVKPLLA